MIPANASAQDARRLSAILATFPTDGEVYVGAERMRRTPNYRTVAR